MKETEARLVESRHRVTIVTARYNRRRALFGRRLAAMQQSGNLSYLQMFLGSRTLSDLTRRAQLYETMTESDASLQSGLRADKRELEEANVALQRQWHQRNRLQRAEGQERRRIILAEQQRRATLNKLLKSRNAILAYSQAQEQSSRELTETIQQLTAKRAEIIAQYEAQAAAERAAAIARSPRRYAQDDGPHYSERRYRRRRVTRRVNTVRYVRQPSGELKPMNISELRTETRMEPIAQTMDTITPAGLVRSPGGFHRAMECATTRFCAAASSTPARIWPRARAHRSAPRAMVASCGAAGKRLTATPSSSIMAMARHRFMATPVNCRCARDNRFAPESTSVTSALPATRRGRICISKSAKMAAPLTRAHMFANREYGRKRTYPTRVPSGMIKPLLALTPLLSCVRHNMAFGHAIALRPCYAW
jgi:peptidoglycan hydrolase CwlO-like protein